MTSAAARVLGQEADYHAELVTLSLRPWQDGVGTQSTQQSITVRGQVTVESRALLLCRMSLRRHTIELLELLHISVKCEYLHSQQNKCVVAYKV